MAGIARLLEAKNRASSGRASSEHKIRGLLEALREYRQPFARRPTIDIRENQILAARDARARVARRASPAIALAQQPDIDTAAVAPDDVIVRRRTAVIDDDNFEAAARRIQAAERLEAFAQLRGRREHRHDDGE